MIKHKNVALELISHVLVAIGLIILAVLMAGVMPGCAMQSAQTRAQAQAIANQRAQQQAKDQTAAMNGQDNPVLHPIAAANESVKALRPWLILLSIIGTVGWIAAFALGTQLPLLGSLTTAFRWVAILSVSALFSLPFIPLCFFIVGGAFAGLVIYELVKTRSISATEAAIIADVDELDGKAPAVSITASSIPAGSTATASASAGTATVTVAPAAK